MDFKVTGSEKGITAFQMDIKISGISIDIMKTALEQAKDGRIHILKEMSKTINEPSKGISEYAPTVLTYNVDVEKIGAIIGPGGQNIRNISETSGTKVNIDDDGVITIFAKDGAKSAAKALDMIKAFVEEPEIGHVYEGQVKRIMDFGAFIEILPGKEGLCHISKLSSERVNSVEDVLKEGQKVKVRLIEIDRMGRLNLSIVDAENENWKNTHSERRPSREHSREHSRRPRH
jgi:polyribonucleotide nucleotidyltransferase